MKDTSYLVFALAFAFVPLLNASSETDPVSAGYTVSPQKDIQSGEDRWWGPQEFSVYRQQLLFSEDFEGDTVGESPSAYQFDPQAAPFVTVIQDPDSNSKAMAIECGNVQWMKVLQNYAQNAVLLEEGEAYQLSLKMKSEFNDYPLRIGFDTQIPAGTVMHDGTTVTTDQYRINSGKRPFLLKRGWNDYVFNFVFPKTGESYFSSTWQYLYTYFECSREYSYVAPSHIGKVYLDDIKIYKVTNNDQSGTPEHQNLLKNSDFELGAIPYRS